MKSKLIKLVNETIDKTTKARATSNKIMADNYAENLVYDSAFRYSNYVFEDDALSRIIMNDLDNTIQYTDLGNDANECYYKEMWEELKKRIGSEMDDHLDSQRYMANRKYYAVAFEHARRREELDNVLTIMRHLEEERFNK